MARRWYDYDTRNSAGSDGVNDAWWVKHQSFGRENSDVSPYLIANEWICGNIANILRLPVPPFALMRSGPTAKGMFVSWKYGSRRITPDDAMPERCYANMAPLVVGIVLFDVLIANSDRHTGNLKVDNPYDPKLVDVFDHDRALFGIQENNGKQRLLMKRDQLGVTADGASRGNRHCFLDLIDDAKHFPAWTDRISEIPERFIREICVEACGLPINQDEALTAADFLIHRKKHLAKTVRDHEHEFRGMAAGGWGIYA